MVNLLKIINLSCQRKLASITCLFIVIALITAQSVHAANTNTQPLKLIVLSDIHFDPFLSCDSKKPCRVIKQLQSLPANQWRSVLAEKSGDMYHYRQNSNYALLQSSLSAASKTARDNDAKFVLVLGDNLAHHFRRQYKRFSLDYSRAGYQSFVRKTLQFVSQELSRAFPTISVYNVVGNNDTYHYDYSSYPGGQFFNDTAYTWSSLVKIPAQRRAMQQQFSVAGYYALNLTSDLRLVVLNSVLFSTKAKGRAVEQAAEKQLLWLQKQLSQAKSRQQKVFIAMHIPSGIDIYAHLNYRFLRLLELWRHEDVLQFEADLNQYSATIGAIFTGHLHRDWFQLVTLSNQQRIAVLGSPAVSPIYGNNPGYKLYTYTPGSRQLIDFETYYLPLSRRIGWQASLRMTRPNVKMCQLSLGEGRFQQEKLFNSLSLRRDRQLVNGLKWRPVYHCQLDQKAIFSV